VKSTHKFPPGWFTGLARPRCLGDGLFLEESGLDFLRIPPVASQKPLESWVTSPFSFVPINYTAYPPEDVIAVAEQKDECVTHPLIVRGTPIDCSQLHPYTLPKYSGWHPLLCASFRRHCLLMGSPALDAAVWSWLDDRHWLESHDLSFLVRRWANL